jgi:hypothetical protein
VIDLPWSGYFVKTMIYGIRFWPFNVHTMMKGILLFLGLTAMGPFSPKPNALSITRAQKPPGLAVVELFTSEGCSSCPAADDALVQLAGRYPSDVYILGFHVDYWNNLGWKDPYSDAAFSDRQRRYGAVFGLRSIYTPEVVVNGEVEFVGSDRNRLVSSIEQQFQKQEFSTILLSARLESGRSFRVSYKTKPRTNSLLNIAVVQLHAQTDVKRGENAGRLLHHINIVRSFTTLPVAEEQGSIQVLLPIGLAPGDCRVIAYLQDRNSLRVTGAGQTLIR